MEFCLLFFVVDSSHDSIHDYVNNDIHYYNAQICISYRCSLWQNFNNNSQLKKNGRLFHHEESSQTTNRNEIHKALWQTIKTSRTTDGCWLCASIDFDDTCLTTTKLIKGWIWRDESHNSETKLRFALKYYSSATNYWIKILCKFFKF